MTIPPRRRAALRFAVEYRDRFQEWQLRLARLTVVASGATDRDRDEAAFLADDMAAQHKVLVAEIAKLPDGVAGEPPIVDLLRALAEMEERMGRVRRSLEAAKRQ